MDAFCDTNVLISYVFLLDYLNRYSEVVFKQYSSIFYSDNVKDEYECVFKDKYNVLSKQIYDLERHVNQNYNEFYHLSAVKNEFSNSSSKEFIGFLDLFWKRYLEFDNYVSSNQFSDSLDICRRDLKENTFFRDLKLKEKLSLVNNSTDCYDDINEKLKALNVHTKDRKIVLDAHDFNLKNEDIFDFITFDEKFLNGIKSVEEFSFRSIKGKLDFNNQMA